MDGFGGGGKPPKKKRTSQDRFAWHACFHGDALLGVASLDDGERGVYVTLIWLMYQHRRALPLDQTWLARQCNIPVQRLRARLDSLEAKGRIVIDREAGLVLDERVIRELVAGDRLRESQTKQQSDRAKKRWGHLSVIEGNVPVPLDPALTGALARLAPGDMQNQLPPQTPPQPTPQTPKNRGGWRRDSKQNQRASRCGNDAKPYPYPDKQPPEQESPAPAPRAALPPRGGGATLSREEIEARLADQRRRLGLTEEGKEGEPVEPAKTRGKTRPGADRKASRA